MKSNFLCMQRLRALPGALFLPTLSTIAIGFAVTLAVLLLADTAGAQTDPRGVYRTFNTEHFRVHFRISDDSTARRAAVIAEDAYRALSRELNEPSGIIELLLTDNLDLTNGYAQVFPTNRIVVYLQPPAFTDELRYSVEWLRTVIAHELAHIFQMESAPSFERKLRSVFGRNPILFPGAYAPSWFTEGIGVHYETQLTGSGRGISTSFPTVARAAAADSAVQPPSSWSLSTARFPMGQTPYVWGSLLVERIAAGEQSTSGARSEFGKTVAQMGILPLPASGWFDAEGNSFASLYNGLRDSLYADAARAKTLARTLSDPSVTPGISGWRSVSTSGFYATSPRWQGNDTLIWTANDGRQVTGLYRAVLSRPGASPERVSRRNSLGGNAPKGDGIVYAQHDYLDPYVYRSDLYESRRGSRRDRRLTSGARLAAPDVRQDGTIVAVKSGGGTTFLAIVSPDGLRVRRLTGVSHSAFTEPRWSPDGSEIVAVELMPDAVQRIVLMGEDGVINTVVAGGNAVFSSPSFTPDGRRLVWVSDRSGASQIETISVEVVRNDTARWRDNSMVRQISHVATGLHEPVVSPDGKQIAALLYTSDGMNVVVAGFDTVGTIPVADWYENRIRARRPWTDVWTDEASAARIRDTLQSTRYSSLRQMRPSYWMPIAEEGRTGSVFGLGSSGYDITRRHVWSAGAMTNTRFDEINGYANYRFAGFGVPLFDLSFLQRWDATLRATDTAGVLIGEVARRRRFMTLSTTVPIPRVRHYFAAALGVQFEKRAYTSDVDAALGGRRSVLRTGTTYQSFFGSLNASTTRSGVRAISREEGFSVGVSTSYRWRIDVPELTESWRTVAVANGFIPLSFPGFSRHVLATRLAAGTADRRTASEFTVGGVSGQSTELAPGVVAGESNRLFPVRGFAPEAQRGSRALSATVEYRAPLVLITRSPFGLPLFANTLSFNAFADAGRAWCPAGVRYLFDADICDRRKDVDGWIASAGGELSLDMAVPYDFPFHVRFGVAAPVAAPGMIARDASTYFTLGSYF